MLESRRVFLHNRTAHLGVFLKIPNPGFKPGGHPGKGRRGFGISEKDRRWGHELETYMDPSPRKEAPGIRDLGNVSAATTLGCLILRIAASTACSNSRARMSLVCVARTRSQAARPIRRSSPLS